MQNEVIRSRLESDDVRGKKMRETLRTTTLPNNLKLFDNKIAKSKSGFLAPSGLSWADLHLLNVLDWPERSADKKEAALANFKHVKQLDAKLRALPNVAAWIAKRPKSDF